MMLAHAASMFVVGPDETARSLGAGKVRWKPRLTSAQITEAFAERTWGFPSAAAFAVAGADGYTALGQPYCAELPTAVLEIIAAEPSSAIGLNYQRYVRSTYLPAVRRIAAVLRDRAAAIEWPSVAWRKETFPGRASADGAGAFASVWLGYTRSWEMLLAAWDEGGCAVDNDRCAGALSPLCPTTPTLPKWKAGAVRLLIDGGADG